MINFNTTEYDKLKISFLKRMADYWLRQFLLNNTKQNAYKQIKCPIKNRYFKPNNMEASHFIDRSVMATRYDLDNVHLISKQSNTWDAQVQVEGYKSKHHKEYEEMLKFKLGEKKFEELLDKSKEITIFARKDYIRVIEKFRNGSTKTSF